LKYFSFLRFLPQKTPSNDTVTVVKNFFFLSLIQLTNFLIPVIILPYLVRTIGIENFGSISIAQALMSYFIIITDFGFNLTSTREIVFNRNNTEELSRIVSSTLILKALLAAVTFVLLVIIMGFVEKFQVNSQLYYLSFLLVIGQVLLPTWFFQGMEKIQYLAYINFASKVVFTVLIFFLITSPPDYIYVPVYLSLGNILAGLIGIWIMFRKFKLRFYVPKVIYLINDLRTGLYVMYSNFAINAYINSNILILGLFTNNLVTGYFSIAERILYCIRQILTLFFQATYPQVCSLAKKGNEELKLFFRKFFSPFVLLVTILCLGMFIFADLITLLLVKDYNPDIINAIRLFSFVPLVICMNIPAYQTLLAYNLQKTAMFVLVTGALLNIVLNLVLSPYFLMNGTIASVIVTEVYITSGLYFMLAYKHPSYSLLSTKMIKWKIKT
jgi:PST family polysaccharide transporter